MNFLKSAKEKEYLKKHRAEDILVILDLKKEISDLKNKLEDVEKINYELKKELLSKNK